MRVRLIVDDVKTAVFVVRLRCARKGCDWAIVCRAAGPKAATMRMLEANAATARQGHVERAHARQI